MRPFAHRADVVIAEGAGGFLVPLDATRTCAELPALLGMDVILVVGLRLGCLNHALLTAEAIAARGLTLAGWVGNGVAAEFPRREANVATLTARLPAPCLGIVPWMARTRRRNGRARARGARRACYASLWNNWKKSGCGHAWPSLTMRGP